MNAPLELIPVTGIPEVRAGDDLAAIIARQAPLADGDVVAIAQKVVSKAENRRRRLADVRPGERARELAAQLGKDPALVELILGESRRIVRAERVLIVETNGGLVCANAGIDSSNAGIGSFNAGADPSNAGADPSNAGADPSNAGADPSNAGIDSSNSGIAPPNAGADPSNAGADPSNAGAAGEVLLLPVDPDGSARRLRAAVAATTGLRLAVVISDSFGRPWRVGQTEVAIGCAGIDPLDDWRGRSDRDGRELAATEIALADEIAAASDLVRDKAAGIPVVIVRGLADRISAADGPGAAALRRNEADDLFR